MTEKTLKLDPKVVVIRSKVLIAALLEHKKILGERTLTETTERLLIEKLSELNGGSMSNQRRSSRAKRR